MSSSVENLVNEAAEAYQAGRLADAERLGNQALTEDQDNQQGLLLMGLVLSKAGRANESIPFLERALLGEPGSFKIAFRLSTQLRRAGRTEEAIGAARRAIELRPDDPHGYNHLGLCLLDGQRYVEAIEQFRNAIGILPGLASAHSNLAIALVQMGAEIEALQEFQSALTLEPNSVASLVSLGRVLNNREDHEGAVLVARRALSLDPDSGPAHAILGRALLSLRQDQEGAAEEHLRAAVNADPKDGSAQATLGQALLTRGRLDEARESFRRAIELKPNEGYPYFLYFHNTRATDEDRPLLDKMESLLEQPGIPRHRTHLHYGLGKALDDLGDFENAMRHYDEANRISHRLRFGERRLDREGYAAMTDRMIDRFPASRIEEGASKGSQSELPVFVVGMIRSGTTLVEQILSSHKLVAGAGELRFWPEHLQDSAALDLSLSDAQMLPRLADEYCSLLDAIAPNNERIVDKMPMNCALLGPIHMALPRARIIHVRRHPVDTCLSIYMTPNRDLNAFAHDRENIVFCYKEHLRLMEHWRRALPSSEFLEIDYEQLIADPERISRQMIAFVGLEWSEDCLRPQENVRTVFTPSVWQVRQPIYSTSVGRWKNYEPWLGPFKELQSAS